MEPPATAATHTQPEEADRSARRRSGCFDVFKELSKSAWRKVSGAARDPTSSTHPATDPPIQSLVVDDDTENTPPVVDPNYGSGPIEVDPNETSDFKSESISAVYLGNSSNQERISALCARYGLPYDPEALKPTQITVPKRTRQRVRTTCHICNSVFKSERVCQKCGHGKCSDCARRPATEARPLTDKSLIISIDSSDDEKSIEDHKESDSHPPSINTRDPEDPEREALPAIERSKYVCHKCFGEFATATNALCESCGHEKCSRCSRQVVHVSLPLDEASGDLNRSRQHRVHRPCKQRVRHYCDHCGTMFAPRTRVCGECQHTRCKNCSRHPHKRRKLEAAGEDDPEVTGTFEARTADVEGPVAASSSRTRDESVS